MAIRPSALRLLGGPPIAPREPESGWTDYIKSAVMAPLHVLGSGYKGIGTVASGLDSAIRTGDLFAGFKLNPEDREGSLLDDAASAFGFGDTVQGTRSPFGVAADAIRSGFGGQGAEAVDPEWEAAFRRAAPITTGIEAAGTLAGEFGTQAVLDPVGHGLAALGTRGTLGASQALRAAEKAPTYNVLPEAISRAVPGLSRVSQGTIPKRILSMSPEAAARGAHALGAAFVPGMALSAAENLSRAPEAIAEHGVLSPEAVESAGQGLVDAAFAGLGAYHAMRGRAPGESLPEVREAQAQGTAETVPVKKPYEAPGIAWRRKSYEDLLSLSPEEQARLEDLNGLEPSPEMLLALEGKAPEIASPETSVPSLEDAFRARAGEAPDMSFEGFVDIPGELAVKPTYEDVLRRAREEVAAQPTMPAQSAPELGVPLPLGATEVLRVPLHEVAAADLRGREGKRGARPQNQEQLAADAVFAEAEKIANEINKSGGTGPEVTVADVIEGRAPIQVTGPKKLGGGLRLDTPEQKRNALAAIAARIADNAESNRGIDNQALREGVDNGRLAEMLEAKLAAKGMRPSRPVLTPDREIAEHDAVAGEAGFPDDTFTPTRQEDPLARAAERMAVVKARKAEVPEPEPTGPSEDALMAAVAKAKTRPVPETTVVEQPRVSREEPATQAKAEVESVPYLDREGNPIENEYFLSPEQAKKATEMGLTQETAELLSEDFDTFGAELEKMDARIRPHMLGLYRKFHATNLAPRAGEGVHAVLRGEEKPAEPALLVDRDTPIEKRYTTVAAPRREAPQPYTQKSELPAGFGVPKGPSLLEKMAARAKAAKEAGLGDGEKASVGPRASETPPVKALLSAFKDTRRNVIKRVEQLEDGGIRVWMKDGQEIEFHPTGEIIASGKDIANREGRIRGAFKTVGAKSYIRLVEGEATFDTILHEEFHSAFLRQFNASEQKEFFRQFREQIKKELKFNPDRMNAEQRKAAEEIVAEGVAKWADAYLKEVRRTGSTKHMPGWFKRLWDYITRVVRAFKSPEFEALAKDFAEGKIYDRSGAERFARKVGERLRGEGAEATNGGERYQVSQPAARTALDEARAAYEGALAASRGLRGPAEKAASARVREARKALKLAEEGVRASEAPLSTPPLASGHVRLYRGEGTGPKPKLPAWAEENAGRWFTTDLDAARAYAKQVNGKVIYVDAPASAVRTWAMPLEEGSTRTAGKVEYLPPREIAEKALPLDRPPLSIAGHAPKDPAAGAEGPVSPTQVSLKQARVQAWRKELGKAPFDWSSNVPQSHRSLIPKAEHILETETPEQIFAKRAPDPAREMAKDAFLRGRQADMEVLQAKRAKILEEGGDTGEVNAEALLAGLDLQIAELTQIAEKFGIKDVEYATALARTLSVRNVIMSAGRSLPDTFLRDLFKKHPNISSEKANALAEMVRDGKFEDLPEALFAAVEPGAWPKFLEWWKAGLVSAPGTLGVANPAGNVGEGFARLAEGPFAVLTDAVVAKATGRARERTFGEVGAEARAASAAAPEAWRSFKDDFSKILKGDYGSLLELDEGARKKGLHELLQYPPAIGAGPKWAQRLLPNGNVGKTVRTPLYILSATDAMFRKIGLAAELGKLSYREAVRELGAGADKKALALKAQEIEALAKEPGSAYEHILRKAEEAARERVFQAETPALRSVKSLRANVRPLGIPIGHLAVPFLDTPFNIFKIMIERSPAGSLGAARAWKKFEIAKREGKPIVEVEALRDKAIDLTARAALGTAMFTLFYGAAKAGLMTGAGPTDPKSKKALMETGWQPYSFKIGDTYIPFNRFEPVSSILGFSADAHEIANKSEKENIVKKTAAAFMTNALSKTYLQGLSDAAGLIVDPERYGPEYAASLAGSVVPNVVAKAAQAIDPVMRETRPPDGGALGRVKATVQSRIPGASMLLPEQRTLTGEVRERPNAGSIAGAVSRFALPLQVTRRKAGAEIQEEFARIGFTPPVPDRKMRVSGQEIVLATTELPKLGEEYKKATARAERLLRSPAYRGAPDEAGPGERSKRKLLDRLYDEANERFKARYASVLRARARAKAAQPRASV